MSNQWASDQFHIYSFRRKNKIIWPTICILWVYQSSISIFQRVNQVVHSSQRSMSWVGKQCVTQPWAPSGFSATSCLQDRKSVSCAGTTCCSHVALTRSRPKVFCTDLLLFVKCINLVWLNFISAWLGASWDPGNWLSSLLYELCSCSQNVQKMKKHLFSYSVFYSLKWYS